MPKKKAARAATSRRSRQEQRDIAAAADAREGIRQGLEDVKDRTRAPAREFFKEFEAERGLQG